MISKTTLIFTMFCVVLPSHCLRLKGEWKTSNFFHFLTKFGFQKTDLDDMAASRGYIYGNISLNQENKKNISTSHLIDGLGTLVVLDGEFFVEVYGNASHMPRDQACQWMFSKTSTLAWHRSCNPRGRGDFLRSVPCHGLCPEEDDPSRVIVPHQLTYVIQDIKQPRYWYLSIVGCHWNSTTCQWESTSGRSSGLSLNYDLWLVNGDPSLKHYNKFEHQFSFDSHDTMELFLFFTLLYLGTALFVQFQLRPYSTLTLLLSSNLWLEAFGSCLISIHLIIFSSDGLGVPSLVSAGGLFRQWADSFLLLLLVTIAEQGIDKSSQLLVKWLLISVLLFFLFTSSGFYLWALTDMDPVLDLGTWSTVPGCLLLSARFLVTFWFLLSLLRHTSTDTDLVKGVDLLQFGAGYLLWFLTLPLIVIVTETWVSSLWRDKCIISVTYCCNFVASSGLVYILWRAKSEKSSNTTYSRVTRYSNS